MMWRQLFICLFAPLVLAKYDQYILAPSSRTLYPSSVYAVNGTVDAAESLCSTSPGSASFRDYSSVTFDYGKNIGGIASVTVGSSSDEEQYLGVAFSESSLWISDKWSDATADAGNDEILWWKITGPGSYTLDPQYVRGGFRYLTLVHNTTGTVEVTQVSTHFSGVPHIEEDQMRNYTGWFNSDGALKSSEMHVLPTDHIHRRLSQPHMVRWRVHRPALHHRSALWQLPQLPRRSHF